MPTEQIPCILRAGRATAGLDRYQVADDPSKSLSAKYYSEVFLFRNEDVLISDLFQIVELTHASPTGFNHSWKYI